jgi:hypothetical protein
VGKRAEVLARPVLAAHVSGVVHPVPPSALGGPSWALPPSVRRGTAREDTSITLASVARAGHPPGGTRVRRSGCQAHIRRLVLCVGLVGSRRICAGQVGCLVDPDGSRRLQSDRLDDQPDDQARQQLNKSDPPARAFGVPGDQEARLPQFTLCG